MAGELDLGSLSVESPSHHRRLQLHGTAKLAPSRKDDIDQLELRLTQYKLSHDKTHLPFVVGGNNCQLNIHLRVDDDVKIPLREDQYHELALYFQRLKVFRELGLVVQSIDVNQEPAGAVSLRLTLEHNSESTSGVDSKLHKLDNGVPCIHVRPPDGSRYVSLQAVDLVMTITKSALHTSLPMSADVTDMLDLSAVDYTSETNEMLEIDQPDVLAAFAYSEQGEQVGEPGGSDLILDLQSEGISDPTKDFPNEQRCRHPNSLESLMDLVAGGLCAAIGHRSDDPCQHLKMTKQRFTSLQTVAPTMWRAGYAAALAERAAFLPTIAHSIAATCRKHPVTARLQARPSDTRLYSSFDEMTVIKGEHSALEEQQASPARALRYHLWHLLERTVYHTKRSRPSESPMHKQHILLDVLNDESLELPAQDLFCEEESGFDPQDEWGPDGFGSDICDYELLEYTDMCVGSSYARCEQSSILDVDTSECKVLRSSSNVNSSQTTEGLCRESTCESPNDTIAFAFVGEQDDHKYPDDDLVSMCSSMDILSLPEDSCCAA